MSQNKLITISLKKSTKTIKLRQQFDVEVHTVLDVKRVYCNQEGGSKNPDKMVLMAQKKELINNKKLKQVVPKGRRVALFSFRFRSIGGAALKERPNYSTIYNSNRTRKLNKADGDIKLSKKNNCLCCCKGRDLAEMPCGHSFCPETMWNLTKNVFTGDEYSFEVICPYPNCKTKFDFDLCAKVADMNDDEYLFLLEEIEIRTAPELRECPFCQEDNERPDNLTKYRINCTGCTGGDWCWLCSGKWVGSGFTVCGNNDCMSADINKQLAECKDKKTTYKDSNGNFVIVPEFRACPNCLEFIEHEDACKHMKCYDCGHDFCFSCLKGKVNGSWQCGSHRSQCIIAPRQKF